MLYININMINYDIPYEIKVGFTIVKVCGNHVFFFLQVTISVMTDFCKYHEIYLVKTMVNFKRDIDV